MKCVFLGHREAPDGLKSELKRTILALASDGSELFVGNNGGFDALVQSVFLEMANEGCEIKYTIVLSKINELALSGKQKNTVFPEGQEAALPRFAISKRNEWLFKNADIVVTYMKNEASNTYKYVSRAKKKGAKIINLAK